MFMLVLQGRIHHMIVRMVYIGWRACILNIGGLLNQHALVVYFGPTHNTHSLVVIIRMSQVFGASIIYPVSIKRNILRVNTANFASWRFLSVSMMGSSRSNGVHMLLFGGSFKVVTDSVSVDIPKLALVLVVKGKNSLENVL